MGIIRELCVLAEGQQQMEQIKTILIGWFLKSIVRFPLCEHGKSWCSFSVRVHSLLKYCLLFTVISTPHLSFQWLVLNISCAQQVHV